MKWLCRTADCRPKLLRIEMVIKWMPYLYCGVVPTMPFRNWRQGSAENSWRTRWGCSDNYFAVPPCLSLSSSPVSSLPLLFGEPTRCVTSFLIYHCLEWSDWQAEAGTIKNRKTHVATSLFGKAMRPTLRFGETSSGWHGGVSGQSNGKGAFHFFPWE